ncbi:hypothetical protein ABPG72_009819 [Tetrahymena utriculariae]
MISFIHLMMICRSLLQACMKKSRNSLSKSIKRLEVIIKTQLYIQNQQFLILQISKRKQTLLQSRNQNNNKKAILTFTNMVDKKLSMENFDIIQVLGRGSFGEVILAKNKSNNEFCAIKILEKSYLAREKKQYQVFIEKEVLTHIRFDGIIQLLGSFKDAQFLYFVLEYCEGGEFSSYLQHNFKFLNVDTIRFYVAEIVYILENLHKNGIIHRDLKPENLMLSKDNHLKIIDFGTCGFDRRIPEDLFQKINNIKKKFPQETDPIDDDDSRARSSTFVGTAEYVSPELLEGEICTASADLWALGCIIYRMFVGNTPFVDINDATNNEFKVFNRVKACQYSIPDSVPAEAADLIKNLLKRNPFERIGGGEPGVNDINTLKKHPFFKGINWLALSKQAAPKREICKQTDNEDDDINDFAPSSPQTPPVNTTSMRPLITGRVLKKVAWLIYKPRQLILQEEPPKLVYYDPMTNIKKGEIPLSKNVKIELQDKSRFTIVGPKKKYFFKELDHPANIWVEKVSKLIKDKFDDLKL